MKHAKVQNLRALREEMKAVARGERPASPDAGQTEFQLGRSDRSAADTGQSTPACFDP